jgi:hypothetical protein
MPASSPVPLPLPSLAPAPAAPLILTTATITIRPWSDPVLEQFGHDPRSAYVERYWLAILGPSATWLMRHLAYRFDEEPTGFVLDLEDTSRAIGVGIKQLPGAVFLRILERIISFGFAQLVDDTTLVVRRHMPSLTRRQVQRLPRAHQRAHDQDQASRRDHVHPDQVRRRARALALSLFELGEDYEGTERQLHRWAFHPAVTHDAVRWAQAEHADRQRGLLAASAAAADAHEGVDGSDGDSPWTGDAA